MLFSPFSSLPSLPPPLPCPILPCPHRPTIIIIIPTTIINITTIIVIVVVVIVVINIVAIICSMSTRAQGGMAAPPAQPDAIVDPAWVPPPSWPAKQGGPLVKAPPAGYKAPPAGVHNMLCKVKAPPDHIPMRSGPSAEAQPEAVKAPPPHPGSAEVVKAPPEAPAPKKQAPPPGPPPEWRLNTTECPKGHTHDDVDRLFATIARDGAESSNKAQVVGEGSDSDISSLVDPPKGGEHGSAEARKESYFLQIESGACTMYIRALDCVWGPPSAVDIYANRFMQSHRAAYTSTTSTQTTSTKTTETQTIWKEVKEVVIQGCESF